MSESDLNIFPEETDPDATSSLGSETAQANAEAWQRIIDDQLIEWGWHFHDICEEDVEPPTRDVVRLAIDLAKRLKSHNLPPPTRVVPDANGGIVFELQHGSVLEAYHVWDDGTVEYDRFVNAELVERATSNGE